MPVRSKLTFPTNESRAAWASFHTACKVVNERIEKALRAASGLTLTEFEVLWNVNFAGGRLRFMELAKLIQLSQSRISRQIDILEQKGFLLREITSTNRRATYAILTPAGRTIYEAAEQPFLEAWHAHFLHHIPPEDLSTFVRIMRSLTAEWGEWIYDAAGEPSGRAELEPPTPELACDAPKTPKRRRTRTV